MRYVTRRPAPRMEYDWWDSGPMLPMLCVDGPASVSTGLVDRHGNEIERVQPPIGFGRDGEW